MTSAGIPIFPAGVVKQYKNPNPPEIASMDDFNFNKQANSNPETTQFGTENPNILEHKVLLDLKVWFEECIKDYLDNEMTLDYKEFWISESWLNKSWPGSHQSMHNHGNSLISGVYYHKTIPEHPPLIFERVTANLDPFVSLRKHYKASNQNFTNKIGMPAESGTLIMFNSYLYHGFGVNNTKEPRISLPFNVLANLSDRDSFKMDFVKQESWLESK